MLPLYAFVLVDIVNWIWCLFIVAGINPFGSEETTALGFLFKNRHGESNWNLMVFIFVWGYMAGLNGLAGHELIHKREPYNKTIGMLTYTKILYSHFFLEHGSGHHRNVATELDPATAYQGETFYAFFPRSAFGGLVCTYKREVERIEAEFAEIHRQQNSVPPPSVPMLVSLCQNRVVQYSAIHCAILVAIYGLLGPKAVIF